MAVFLTSYRFLGIFLTFSGTSQIEDYDHAGLDGDWEKPDNTESGRCADSIYSGKM